MDAQHEPKAFEVRFADTEWTQASVLVEGRPFAVEVESREGLILALAGGAEADYGLLNTGES
jgi:hypothetical protein